MNVGFGTAAFGSLGRGGLPCVGAAILRRVALSVVRGWVGEVSFRFTTGGLAIATGAAAVAMGVPPRGATTR